jgi:hypothetical protein
LLELLFFLSLELGVQERILIANAPALFGSSLGGATSVTSIGLRLRGTLDALLQLLLGQRDRRRRWRLRWRVLGWRGWLDPDPRQVPGVASVQQTLPPGPFGCVDRDIGQIRRRCRWRRMGIGRGR